MSRTERLAVALRRPPPQPGLALSITIGLGDSDADDDGDAGAELAAALGYAFVIDYLDSAGQPSCRRVTLRTLARAPNGAVLLNCFCHERNAARAFRLDRVRAVIESSTGEIFESMAEYCRHLAGEPRAVRNDTHATLAIAQSGMAVLAFLAHADGEFHDAEREVILDFTLAVAGPLRPDIAALERHVRAINPDPVCFERGHHAVLRSPDLRPIVDRHVRRLVDADGIVSREEFDALLRMRGELAS